LLGRSHRDFSRGAAARGNVQREILATALFIL
jgi:hypothetical protein